MKKHDERRYEGWSNYETWAVSLWLDNDEPSYRYWREQVEQHRREAGDSSRVQEGIWTPSEALRFNLADQIKEVVNDGSPLNEASLYSDLLSAAISEVNWTEIADHWLNE